MEQQRFALISVSDKRGVAGLASALLDAGFQLLSTGGTARHLRAEGLEVMEVSALTGASEILDGRVKTLHPTIHGGLLARRDVADHLAQMEAHGLPHIDVVVVNLYPFEQVAARADATVPELVEQIDIGGPTMLRAAAKNFAAITVVVDPDDYAEVAAAFASAGEGPSLATRARLAQKVFAHTSRYDQHIASTLAARALSGEGADEALPAQRSLVLERQATLRYGENPHQQAALYSAPGAPELGGVRQLHGKQLGANNLVDLDAAICLVREFDAPAVAILKHTNPCGCAQADTLEAAYDAALASDPISAFGGIVAVNRPVTAALAERLHAHFFEVVSAPAFESDALEILTRKKNIRLMETPADLALPALVWRETALGVLVQTADPRITLDREACTIVTGRAPSDEEWAALAFAWRVCKHVKSNAIVIGKGEATVGVGAGQMSRVDSVQLAVRKARCELRGSVLASDAFFPFRDGVDAAAEAGVRAIIQPGGSRRDQEVIDACNEHGIAMIFTGKRHFRH